MLPVFKPLLPSADTLLPILAKIDANRYYTNNGPLVVEFEERLAAACGAAPDQVATSSNCTMALAQALRARLPMNLSSDALCILPSWTFVATPASVVLAQLKPFFADVSPTTWALDPEHVVALANRLRAAGNTVAAVMPVAPFGACVDLVAWADFEERTGIPVVIDAAASFDAMSLGTQATAKFSSRIPVVLSLHATKAFGIGEGGFVLSTDTELIKRIRTWGNFGFHGSRVAIVPGWNAKLGEMYAAVGLTLLDQWPTVRAEWRALTEHFCRSAVELAPHARIPTFMTADWISAYGLLQLSQPCEHVSGIVEKMSGLGIQTLQWWGNGCHLHPAYCRYGREPLPNTERLAATVLGMPFWRQIAAADMVRAAGILRMVLAQHA
jgi:dTDP-4-amino-4,6-dideoxygalactose transaminase